MEYLIASLSVLCLGTAMIISKRNKAKEQAAQKRSKSIHAFATRELSLSKDSKRKENVTLIFSALRESFTTSEGEFYVTLNSIPFHISSFLSNEGIYSPCIQLQRNIKGSTIGAKFQIIIPLTKDESRDFNSLTQELSLKNKQELEESLNSAFK